MPRINLDMVEIVRKYEKGKSCQTIAREHHVGYTTIRRRLIAAGVELRTPYHWNTDAGRGL